jgi:Fic family protein
MKVRIHKFTLELDWNLVGKLSAVDRFDAKWSAIERREGKSLKQLKEVATVKSVGASTRIEGSKLNDAQVQTLLQKISITKFEERDEQEVAGYFELLGEISNGFHEISISENSLKNLHNLLLKRCDKDQWHKGDFKQHSNSVVAFLPGGKSELIFETTPPGFETDDAIRDLIRWFKNDNETHPLVKCALFSYEFVSIHPFQDGNGRLSRLIITLLLLQHGYKWIEYISFEHEIEAQKTNYYQVLRDCQSMRPGEDVSPWINFYLDGLIKIQNELMGKLEESGMETELSPTQKEILSYMSGNPGAQSSDVAQKMDIPLPTVKRILSQLVDLELLRKHGVGRGTNYSI